MDSLFLQRQPLSRPILGSFNYLIKNIDVS
jgi:hypothetical protein